MKPRPSYLRVVITARCSLACAYCHREGDTAGEAAGGLSTPELGELLALAAERGVRKLKFLGGEPLLRADLPALTARLRAAAPALDISMITSGSAPVERLAACFQAGLSRANLSIHGHAPAAFQERTGRGPAAWRQRERCLDLLLAQGRALKLNYVWRGPRDDEDLRGLLDRAAGLPVAVGLLDDLGQDLGPAAILETLHRLRGPAAERFVETDPDSLDTLRLRWADGLLVEVKDQHLGQLAPWASCGSCPVRARCREGIFALRLTHEGRLQPCMDRPELGVDLRAALRQGGREAAASRWLEAVETWTAPAADPLRRVA